MVAAGWSPPPGGNMGCACVQPRTGDGWVSPGYHTSLMLLDTDVTCIVFSRQPAENPWPTFRPCIVSHVDQLRLMAENRKTRSNLLQKYFSCQQFDLVWPCLATLFDRLDCQSSLSSRFFFAQRSWLTAKLRKRLQGRKLATAKVGQGIVEKKQH